MQIMNKVQQGQSFIDMICQTTGSYDGALEMAILNNTSITDDVKIGEQIKGSEVKDQDVINQFAKKQSATAERISLTDEAEILEGIDYWIIEKTFKVS